MTSTAESSRTPLRSLADSIVLKLVIYIAAFGIGALGVFFVVRDAGAAERQRHEVIEAAVVAQGCHEAPVVGPHIVSLARRDGAPVDSQSWFTFPVQACATQWNIEVAEARRGQSAASVSRIEKIQ